MIYAEKGKEQDCFIDFAEKALGMLAKEKYGAFLAVFDSSRLTEQDLTSALQYLDETRPVLKTQFQYIGRPRCKGVCPLSVFWRMLLSNRCQQRKS